MKGIVFTKFVEMAEAKWSPDFVDRLIESCDLPSGGAYTAVGTYDHREMVTILTRLSEMTSIPIPELLKAYGEFLFGEFAKLYPVFFEGRQSAIEFVESIDKVIHVEVRKLYPDAELPRFEVLERTPDTLKILYTSERHLGDLAEGLLLSCIRYFGESDTTRLARENLDSPGLPVCFTLTKSVS